MANTKSNKGNGSLIFTWVIIVLLLVGTFVVYKNYSDNTSKYITNEEVAQALSETFDKPVGRITEDDLKSIKGVLMYKDLPISYTGTTTTAMSAVEFYLEGYEEAYEAFYAEDVTEEQKATLTDPSDLSGYVTLTSTDILDDLAKPTGLTSFEVFNYSDDISDDAIIKFAADNYAELNKLSVDGYNLDDIASIEKIANLTELTISDKAIKDLNSLAKLTKLEKLTIYNSPELSDISALAGLKALKEITINGTAVSDISVLNNTSDIEKLDLSNNNITDVSALSSLDNEKITSLILTGNSIADYTSISHIDEIKVTKDAEEEEASQEDAEKVEEEADNSADETEDDSAEVEE